MTDQDRIVLIFLRLLSGQQLSKNDLAKEFRVSEKTIQRDISKLTYLLSEQNYLPMSLDYNSKNFKRYLRTDFGLRGKDVLILAKILLENRVLNISEMKSVVNRLMTLVSKDHQKELQLIIGSELLNYQPINDRQNRIDKVWDMAQAILQEKCLEISYKSPYNQEKVSVVFPVSLYYDKHYFYLVAYQLSYQTYITLRIDRIGKYHSVDVAKPNISYGKKFRDGDVRNQRVDAFIGEEIEVVVAFKYDPTVVLDQFPTAKIVSQDKERKVITFKSQNTSGLYRWLLSQSEGLEVISPNSLRQKMKDLLENSLKAYTVEK